MLNPGGNYFLSKLGMYMSYARPKIKKNATIYENC